MDNASEERREPDQNEHPSEDDVDRRAEEVEAMGLALMRLEETVRELAERFGLTPEELNIELGPLGRLM